MRLLTFLILLGLALPARASTPTNGWVVWASNRKDGRHEVYLMKSDGTSVKRLTLSGGKYPTFSPDGVWVSYHRKTPNEAWVIRPDGTGDKKIGSGKPVFWQDSSGLVVQQLNDVYRYNPTTLAKQKLWSKTDFSRIASSSYTLFEVSAQTSNKRWLVVATDFYKLGATGDNGTFKHGWGPQLLDLQDKTKIYFVGDGCEGTASPTSDWIYHMNGELYPETRIATMNVNDYLTRSSYKIELDYPQASWGHEYFPRVATDGKWLVYGATTGCHDHETCDYEIHVHKLGVSGDRTRITTDTSNDQWPHMFIGTLPQCTSTSQCDDGDPCTTDACSSSQCTHAAISGCCTLASQCNDSDPCTTDSCSSNKCSHAAISSCCTAASQCNDSDPCTTDSCSSNKCSHAAISNCCTAASQCNDSNQCTTDGCSSNKCTHGAVAGCCSKAADCDDSNACTADSCDTASGKCSNTTQSGCCLLDGDCDDSDACTKDTCASNKCTHQAVSSCCTSASQCNDSDPCTKDSCASNTCSHAAITGCCTKAADCDDTNSCTTDGCSSNKCTHTPLTGCCGQDPDCDDTNPCTTDSCDTSSGTCSNTKLAGCCKFDTDCDDGDSCTADTCDLSGNTCEHQNSCGQDGGGADGGQPDIGGENQIKDGPTAADSSLAARSTLVGGRRSAGL